MKYPHHSNPPQGCGFWKGQTPRYALIRFHSDNSCNAYRANCSPCCSNKGTLERPGPRREMFAPVAARFRSYCGKSFARCWCSQAPVVDPQYQFPLKRRAEARVHEQQKVRMAATRAVRALRCFLRPSLTEAPSLHRHCPVSSVLRASPSPHRARPGSRELPVDRHGDHRWGFPCCV